MEFKAFNLTAQGASHIKKNRECQDASASFVCEDYGIAIVCDGHGGEDYIRSAIGSQKAASIALENIKVFLAEIDYDYLKRHFDELLYTLEKSIISMWRNSIREHWDANPITEEEKSRLSEKATRRYLVNNSISSAYGTTLIAVVVTKKYWFCFQVGDGKCVWVDRDSEFHQLKLDSKCFLNATTSLCDSDALDHFQTEFGEDIPAAVFVGSDGIDDCFKNDDQLYNFYRTMCYSFGTSDTTQAVAELEDFLPRLSKKGSGDDVSIAAVLNMELLPTIKAVVGFNVDDECAKKEKAEQEEAERNAALKAEYERKAEAERRKREEEQRRREEEEKRQKELLARKKRAEEDARLAKVTQSYEEAKSRLEEAKTRLERADRARKEAQEKLNECSGMDVLAWTKVVNKKIEIYTDSYLNYQQALSYCNQVKIAYDSVVRSCTAECPKCHIIVRASSNFCPECGADMSLDPSSFVQQEEVPDSSKESSSVDEAAPAEARTTIDAENHPVENNQSIPSDIADEHTNVSDNQNGLVDQSNNIEMETDKPVENACSDNLSSNSEGTDSLQNTGSSNGAIDPSTVESVTYTHTEHIVDGNNYSYTETRIDIQTGNSMVTDVNNSVEEQSNRLDDNEW